jgi:hypothetical protein
MSTTHIAEKPGASKRRRMPLRALGVLSFAALSGLILLAACGGDDESTATPGGTRTPAATAAATSTRGPAATAAASPRATQAGTATPQASTGEIDPCTLVTKAEAEAIVGESLGEPAVTITKMLVGCLYSTPDFDSVNVDVLTYDSEDDAKSLFQLAIDINHYPEIEGIGDRAYDSRPIGDITVLKGKYELSVDVSTGGEDDFEVAKGLAAKAVDRLP